ncbi:MAG: cellulase-like family protein [Planctomycetaceae bacterium]|nr:hypothetical protein [Planctomycetaceae bacterium]
MDFPPMPPSTVFGNKYEPLRRFDMRDWLQPRRMTAVMWDHAFLTRHVKGDSFEDYDRVLDEAIERGYNTLRIDPVPQSIDLSKPEIDFTQTMNIPYLPWTRPTGFQGRAGEWLIEFMEKVIDRKLYYALSSWWGGGIKPTRHDPHTLVEATECWIDFLTQWKSRFGFDGCAYVDLNNEFPCFLPGMMGYLEKEGGASWSPKWQQVVTQQINDSMGIMRKEFPELKFMVSLHGDVRYTQLELELDCMDIHFYSDADPRWHQRTQFYAFCPNMFTSTDWHAEYSDRTRKSNKAAAAMYRARQRAKVGEFAAMSDARGIPLLTTESWAAWYCIDSPQMDWSWLLEWAEWSVEDAIDYRMWGWTPHNYVQPQFENWKDVRWHQRLTDRFLRS